MRNPWFFSPLSAGSGDQVTSGADQTRDGGGQPFLIGVVVASLPMAAKVVAHDRGHLEPAQGVEPVQRLWCGTGSGVRLHEFFGGGKLRHDTAYSGEIAPIGEDEEPAQFHPRVPDTPDLPVDQGDGFGPPTDQVAESVVAV